MRAKLSAPLQRETAHLSFWIRDLRTLRVGPVDRTTKSVVSLVERTVAKIRAALRRSRYAWSPWSPVVAAAQMPGLRTSVAQTRMPTYVRLPTETIVSLVPVFSCTIEALMAERTLYLRSDSPWSAEITSGLTQHTSFARKRRERQTLTVSEQLN